MKHFYIFLLFGLFFACQNSQKSDLKNSNQTPYFKYAQHIQLYDYGTLKRLKITGAFPNAPAFDYILKHQNDKVPDSLKNLEQITIPLKNIVVTSTTHLPPLQLLGLTGKLIGFPNTNYISNPVFRQLVASGQIKEIGNGRALNTEKVLKLQPDLLMRFSSDRQKNDDDFYKKEGIAVIYNADWMESTPLGRAEWLKLFGLLFEKEKKADQIFNTIAQKYNRIKTQITTTSAKPKVLQGGLFGDKWFVPGGKSYAAQLIKDAGGIYLWQNDRHSGSLTLNYENVLLKMPEASVWLNPGMIVSRQALIANMPVIKDFDFFKNDRIYTYNLKKGAGNGILYFEDSYSHPDFVLDDLFHIFYPDSHSKYKFHYYQKLLN